MGELDGGLGGVFALLLYATARHPVFAYVFLCYFYSVSNALALMYPMN